MSIFIPHQSFEVKNYLWNFIVMYAFCYYVTKYKDLLICCQQLLIWVNWNVRIVLFKMLMLRCAQFVLFGDNLKNNNEVLSGLLIKWQTLMISNSYIKCNMNAKQIWLSVCFKTKFGPGWMSIVSLKKTKCPLRVSVGVKLHFPFFVNNCDFHDHTYF